jgi:alcohol dehydrogenase (cytochrome c)
MYSRTYDAQRFSPLAAINRDNVGSLRRAWSKGLPEGALEIIPLVHRGVMYLTTPGTRDSGSRVLALDAATGELLWEYVPPNVATSRVKALALYGDLLYYTAPAPAVSRAWSRSTPLRTCADAREHRESHRRRHRVDCNIRRTNSERNCFIAARRARSKGVAVLHHPTRASPTTRLGSARGHAARPPGAASTYGPGAICSTGGRQPMPHARIGTAATGRHRAPRCGLCNSHWLRPRARLFSNQHPRHDGTWHRTRQLIRTVVAPDPAHVKWINPVVATGAARDVAITVGEGGGVWVNDRTTGEFLWAMPFPYDTPNFILSNIDVKTGVGEINWNVVLDEPGAKRTICYWNTRSFWPTAYSPRLNSLFVPYANHCLNMTRAVPGGDGEQRSGTLLPGSDPEHFAGIAKIDMRTGAITRLYEGRAAGNGAVLATAGDLVFWGDITQVLRAFDAETGKILWESEPLGATVQTSTITYAVDGRQYVAVINAEALLGARALATAGGVTLPEHRGNSLNVFALPR